MKRTAHCAPETQDKVLFGGKQDWLAPKQCGEVHKEEKHTTDASRGKGARSAGAGEACKGM